VSVEGEAYALMAWKRFDDDVTDELVRAVTSAFALVAASDGDIAQAEDREFLSMLRNKTELFGTLDFDRTDRVFQDVCNAILSDPNSGRARALGEIEAVRQNAGFSELVLSAAEIAVHADDRINPAETRILDEIRAVLELPTT